MKAAALGRTFMIAQLLENGADPTIKSPNGETALDKAQLFDRWEAVELIKAHVEKKLK